MAARNQSEGFQNQLKTVDVTDEQRTQWLERSDLVRKGISALLQTL